MYTNTSGVNGGCDAQLKVTFTPHNKPADSMALTVGKALPLLLLELATYALSNK